jgi:hypothetical protein
LTVRGFITAIAGALTRDPRLVEESTLDLDEALELSRRTSLAQSAYTMTVRGQNAMSLGDVPAAAAALELAVEVSRDLRSRWNWPKWLLAVAVHVLGDRDRAAELIEHVIDDQGPDTIQPVGTPGTTAAVLAGRDPAAATRYLLESYAEVSASNMPGAVEEWVTGAAAVLAQSGDSERASRLLSWVRSVTLDRRVVTRSPASFTIYAHYVRRVREVLGPDASRRLRDTGTTMTLDDAASSALEGLRALRF